MREDASLPRYATGAGVQAMLVANRIVADVDANGNRNDVVLDPS